MGEKGAIKLEDSGQFLEKMGFVKQMVHLMK